MARRRAWNWIRRGLKRPLAIVVSLALAALCLVAATGSAEALTPTHRQSRAKEITSGTVNSLAFSNANQAGNLIVVYLIWNTGSTATLSDTRGNVYAAAAPVRRWNDSTWSSQVFYAKNVAAGTNTVRATFASSITAWADMYIHEYSGVDRSDPLDVSAAAVGTTAAMSSGTATTTNASDLIFGAGASASTMTAAGSGFTTRRTNFGSRTTGASTRVRVRRPMTRPATGTQGRCPGPALPGQRPASTAQPCPSTARRAR